MHRPTSLVVIATLWIIVGAAWALSGLAVLAGALAIPGQIHEMGGPATLPDQAQSVVALGVAGALVQIAAGVAGVVCGSGLVRLRAWARRGLEVLTVLTMLAVAGISASGLIASMSSNSVALFVVPLLLGTVFIVPLWIVRKHLRGRAIREAILLAEQLA